MILVLGCGCSDGLRVGAFNPFVPDASVDIQVDVAATTEVGGPAPTDAVVDSGQVCVAFSSACVVVDTNIVTLTVTNCGNRSPGPLTVRTTTGVDIVGDDCSGTSLPLSKCAVMIARGRNSNVVTAEIDIGDGVASDCALVYLRGSCPPSVAPPASDASFDAAPHTSCGPGVFDANPAGD